MTQYGDKISKSSLQRGTLRTRETKNLFFVRLS